MKNYEYKYEVNGFEKNPLLKKLMFEYAKYNHEENADLSDEGLWIEYNYLKNNKMLHVLFESEKRGVLESEMRLNEILI